MLSWFSKYFIVTDLFGGFVGLAITQSMRLVSSVQWAMKQWAVLENQMHSVERVLEFMEIPQEANIYSPSGNRP